MKTFEMPKMNVAIFSLEDVITTSTGGETTSTNLEVAKATLAEAVGDEAAVTVTDAKSWVDAN